MAIAFLIGRIMVGLFYLLETMNHFSQADMLTGYAASKGVPAPKLAVYGSGLLMLIGGLSILTGFQPVIGVIALVVFYFPVTFVMHNFWAVEDAQMRMVDMINFMKNMALVGSTLMLLAIPQPWIFGLG